MRLHHFLSLIAALSGCTARQDTSPDARPVQEAASAEVASPITNFKRMAPGLGDTVSEIDKAILYVFQAKDNAYWFGSDGQGAYRFDGSTMIHFTTKDGLCNNRIRGIQEDKSGNIYFTTSEEVVTPPDDRPAYRAGFSKFDGKEFSTLTLPESTSSDKAWRLRPDDLWFAGAQDSGVVYRYDGQSLHRLAFPKTKTGEEHIAKYPRSKYPNMTYNPYDVYVIYKDRKGNLWFGTNIGVCCYDGNSFTWMTEDELGFDDSGRAFNVRSIIEDKDGKFWFSSTFHRWDVYRNGLSGKGISLRKEEGIGLPKDQNAEPFAYFMSSVKDNNGDLWMATSRAGVWRYDGKSMTHYPVKDGNKTITLFSIYEDNKGGLWLGTHAAGVLRFNGKAFEKFRM